jgi:hypothetical protein
MGEQKSANAPAAKNGRDFVLHDTLFIQILISKKYSHHPTVR